MQEIRLVKMRICNFKGIRELDITFAGKDMNVLGDNGTGKTSIIDSFTWLLFGKDSLGRADFGIKPTDKTGNIIHQLETSVEAVFDISGAEKVFKKTLVEVWTRKRGAAEAEFTRNENNFYIDGVPKKKGEYTAAIKELIDEEVFKIITNPLYFNESVKWQDRRSVLLTICGEVSDAEVIAANEMLAPLLPLLNGKAVSDFKDITAATMKRVNKELEMIPVKINEAELAKPSADGLEINLARREELTQEIEALRTQKLNILNGSEIAQERQRIQLLSKDLKSVGNGFVPGLTPEAAKIAILKNQRIELTTQLKGVEMRRESFLHTIETAKGEQAHLAKEWDEVFERRFTDSICPTCHRELPEDEVEKRRKEFNSQKAQRLDDIESRNEKLIDLIRGYEESLKEATDTVATMQSKLDEIEADISHGQKTLDDLTASKKAEHEAERDKIRAAIARTEELIRVYEEKTGFAVGKIDSQIASLSDKLSVINTAIANKSLLERQDSRIAELRSQQKRLAGEYTRLERAMYLAEQFIVAKVNMLNERINQKFKYAKFKLFDQQINGGINEVCEVTYQGIPYKDLNNAMRINIGLDVINTIAAHYGVTCPILIDNAESVNDIFHTDAQQIRFYVSTDKKLVFNNKEE